MRKNLQALPKLAVLICLAGLTGACSILIPAERVMPPEQGLTFYTIRNSPAPAVVLLSGCGGIENDATPPIAELLNANGFNVVVVDYVKMMGLEQACLGQIKPDRFLALIIDSLKIIADNPEIDSDHIALLGWSLGASAALTYAEILKPGDRPSISAVVAYYPGCYEGLQLSTHPTLMLLGLADNVVDANACLDLAKHSPQTPLVVKTYPQAQHNFDNPKFKQPKTVHFFWKKMSSAYDENATADAYSATVRFLTENNR